MQGGVPFHTLPVHVRSDVDEVPGDQQVKKFSPNEEEGKVSLGNLEVAFVAGDHEAGVPVSVRHLDICNSGQRYVKALIWTLTLALFFVLKIA